MDARRADERRLAHSALIVASYVAALDIVAPRRQAPRRGRWLRPRRLIALALLVVVVPPAYSYTSAMLKPSSLPLWPRTVEWIRQNHGNWLVDTAEHYYYGWWKKPKPGGPQLTRLPVVGLAALSKPHVRHVVVMRPPHIRPVFAHPLRGEAVWERTGPLVAGRPPVLVTTFRTELAYPRIVAYVMWVDHTRTSLAWYPGRYEPPAAPIRGPMEIPTAQRWRLLATFNGGFIYRDGSNGSSIGGRLYEPLRRGLATMIAYRDGRVDIRSWTGGPVAGGAIAWARQSLPLIVDHGRLNPALNDSNQWGYTLGNAVRVWRTGAGIDRHGNLIYAAADEQTVTTLAEILRRAGAVRAMQLDINPEWPTLIAYAHRHGLDPMKIVPNYQQPETRYLVPDDRDFFAVYRRVPGPVGVPFK
ncbi:MAG TPA: phosphodiester glycosidase family protein [Gaiellaceae bacterium]